MIAWSDVLEQFPLDSELAAVAPLAGAVYAERANRLSSTFFAANTRLARLLYAAHFATSIGQLGAAAAGPVTSRSEGDVSETYAIVGQAHGGAHASTSYGRLFDELVQSSPRRIGLVGLS